MCLQTGPELWTISSFRQWETLRLQHSVRLLLFAIAGTCIVSPAVRWVAAKTAESTFTGVMSWCKTMNPIETGTPTRTSVGTASRWTVAMPPAEPRSALEIKTEKARRTPIRKRMVIVFYPRCFAYRLTGHQEPVNHKYNNQVVGVPFGPGCIDSAIASACSISRAVSSRNVSPSSSHSSTLPESREIKSSNVSDGS